METTQPPEPAPPPRRTSEPADLPAASPVRLRRFAAGAAVVVLIAALAGFLPRWHARSALRQETRQLAIPTVTVVSPAHSKAPPGLELPAEVKAFVESPIYARANGYLKRWLVDIGAEVKAGQLLAEIDTPEINQELARARAELSQAEAALALAKTTAARWKDLLKSSSVSEQETAEKDADLALKLATVDAASAEVKRLEDLLSFARITAPFDGTITARKTDVGQLIVAGSGKDLFQLAQTHTLRVYVHVPQTAARLISIGQTAELTIPELAGRVFPAQVVRTSGAMSSDSRTLLTELEVRNPNREILAGSYAQVRFTDVQMDPPLTVPANTLLFRAEGPQLGIVGAEGKVELRNVKLGRDFGHTLEILEGISAVDRVILNPSDSLRHGSVVRVADADAVTPAAAKP